MRGRAISWGAQSGLPLSWKTRKAAALMSGREARHRRLEADRNFKPREPTFSEMIVEELDVLLER